MNVFAAARLLARFAGYWRAPRATGRFAPTRTLRVLLVLLFSGAVCSASAPVARSASSPPTPKATAWPVARVSAPAASEASQSQLSPPVEGRGTLLLAGRVVDADTGAAIEGARVTLIGASGGPTAGGAPVGPAVITDQHGRFYFANLAPGPYFPMPSREGYVPVFSGQSISLYQSSRLIEVRLRRLGTITGMLRDDAGDPVVGTEVIAYQRTIRLLASTFQPGQAAQFTRIASDRSDNRGAYRLRNLSAGEYFVCACARDPIPFDGPLLTTLASRPVELAGVAQRAAALGADAASLDDTLRTFAPTFHPNTLFASRATKVAVAAGEDKTNIDIDLTAVRAVRVSGSLVGGPGSSLSSAFVRLVPANDLPEAAAMAQYSPLVLQPDGRFDFGGIPPGQYLLVAQYDNSRQLAGPSGAALRLIGARGAASPVPTVPPTGVPLVKLWASEPIAVGDTDVIGLAVALRPRFTVKGRVEYSSAAPPADATERRSVGGLGVAPVTGIALAPLSASVFPAEGGNMALFQERGFTIQNVMPGRYAAVLTRSSPGWRLASISLRGVDVTDAAIDIESRDIDDLVLTLTNAPAASIEVTTNFRSGEILEDVQACLFPTDRRYWAEPLAASRRYGAVRFGARVVAEFRDVPAGEYFVALQRSLAGTQGNGPSFEWVNPATLEDLARTAERVRVSDGEAKSIMVRR
jgi:hypothetical protein